MLLSCLSSVWFFTIPWTVAGQAFLCLWDCPDKDTGGNCHASWGEMFMVQFSSVQWLSRVNSVTPWTPAGPGFPVHHQLLEFAPIYVHHVGAAIQPCHPLSSPSPPAFNLYLHQGLFQWVSSSHPVTQGNLVVDGFFFIYYWICPHTLLHLSN